MDDNKQNDKVEETPSEEAKSSAAEANLSRGSEAEIGESSRLSEAGEIRGESTSSDVHEQDRAGSEPPTGGEEAELENRNQASERSEEPEREEPDEASIPSTPIPTTGNGARWYVVHTYSGHENKVAAALKQKIGSEHLQDKILEVLVPMQDKIEIKGGKKLTVKEKIFPGYILVKMHLDDNSWLAVRTIQGVTSFVGMGNKPTPISDAEVATIVKFAEAGQPTFKQVFSVDDTVKIVDGPFADFIGKIDSVDEERGKVKVLVSIFGRETPVELDFLQVQKI